MNARELLAHCAAPGADYQLFVGQFVDEFRRANPRVRADIVATGPDRPGRLEGLIGAVVSALCREAGMAAPEWSRVAYSPEPFFAFPARGFALRVRLMLESPPPFRIRNVFVPENYLSRA